MLIKVNSNLLRPQKFSFFRSYERVADPIFNENSKKINLSRLK